MCAHVDYASVRLYLLSTDLIWTFFLANPPVPKPATPRILLFSVPLGYLFFFFFFYA